MISPKKSTRKSSNLNFHRDGMFSDGSKKPDTDPGNVFPFLYPAFYALWTFIYSTSSIAFPISFRMYLLSNSIQVVAE